MAATLHASFPTPRAQQAQANGNNFLDRLQADGGSLWDGILGSLCGGYSVCLGGDVLSGGGRLLATRRALPTGSAMAGLTPAWRMS